MKSDASAIRCIRSGYGTAVGEVALDLLDALGVHARELLLGRVERGEEIVDRAVVGETDAEHHLVVQHR